MGVPISAPISMWPGDMGGVGVGVGGGRGGVTVVGYQAQGANLVCRDKSPRDSLKSISPYNYPKRHHTCRRDWDLFPIPSQCNVQNHCKWVVPGPKSQIEMLPISY